MRIGQLAQIAGVDPQTIRFYEQRGLLPLPDRQENGYRIYTKRHIEQLAFIRRCRILDLKWSNWSGHPDKPHNGGNGGVHDQEDSTSVFR